MNLMSSAEIVDLIFDLEARSLPEGFEWPLYQAIARLAPWIAQCPGAGVLPLRGARLDDGALLVARRAKLVVRMPRDRLCAASVLEGAVLDLGGSTVRLGEGRYRALRSSPTLYSPKVALGVDDELAFSDRIVAALDRLDIARPYICGRRVEVSFGGERHTAFGVAIHDLDEDQSLLLQRAGLGHGHAVGCGLFIPHKTIGVRP